MLSRLHSDIRGVAMIEFAFSVPIMLLVLLGAVELPRAMIASNRATYLADAMAQMISQARLPIDTPTMNRYIESAPLIDTSVLDYARQAARTDVWDVSAINVTSVMVTPTVPTCTASCTYRADVVFSVANTGPERTCGQLNAGGNAYSATTLPTGLFQPGPLVVVDVVTSYRPLFTMFFDHPISFHRSAYFRPRYVPRVDHADPGDNHNCAGYTT